MRNFQCFLAVSGVDTTPPVVSGCPTQGVTATAPAGATSTVVTWTEPTATDNSGLPVTRTSDRSPGQSYPLGTTSVEYVFTDASRNTAFCRFVVTVTGKYLRCWNFCEMSV